MEDTPEEKKEETKFLLVLFLIAIVVLGSLTYWLAISINENNQKNENKKEEVIIQSKTI